MNLAHVVFIMVFFFSPYSVADNNTFTTIGWVETVRVFPEGLDIQAKIDTGADHSSLDIIKWNNFSRNGIEWVRFTMRHDNNHISTLERPLERYAQIKRKQSQSLKRPVVNMWLCMGREKLLVPVNLANRNNFDFRMLIGRSFLSGRFLVDSSRRSTLSPQCEK